MRKDPRRTGVEIRSVVLGPVFPFLQALPNLRLSVQPRGRGPTGVHGVEEESPGTMNRIFFYGLFMNWSLLVEKGLHPEIVGPAALPDYRIHIGERATLLRSASSRAYGIVMDLAYSEARALYSEPSVREYQRERVQVELLQTGEAVDAYCYNLPRELGLAGANPAYAAELSKLAEALQFDVAYLEEIAAFGGTS